MSYSHLLTTTPSTSTPITTLTTTSAPQPSASLPTLTTTSTSPQPQPQPLRTPPVAPLPLQTSSSKWRIHSVDCKPTSRFPPLKPSPRPLLHAAAIQIPGSQWRLALKTKASLKPSPISNESKPPPTPSNTPQLPEGSRLGEALAISQSSIPGRSNEIKSNSDTQTGPPERKRTYLDALKYENAIRMQLALKPNCTKLERKMGYLRRWKERWAKFDGLRRVLGCIRDEEENAGGRGEGPSAGASVEGRMPKWNVETMINRSYGDWRMILWPSIRDFSLAPDENHKTLTGSRIHHEERQRCGREWLDQLEREWWGDGFPIMGEGEGERGKECWLDEVD